MRKKMEHVQSLLEKASALLLDFDGTLADSERSHFLANNAAFSIYGHEMDEHDYYIHWTSKGEGIAGEIARCGLNDVDIELLRSRKNRIYEEFCAGGSIRLFPETVELLELINASRFKAAIVTNSMRRHVEMILEVNGISELGMPIISGAPGIRPKPYPDLFLMAAERIETAPQTCLVVEDTEKGLQAARSAGMKCILIPAPYLTREVMDAADAVLNRSGLFTALRRFQTPGYRWPPDSPNENSQ